MPRVHIPALLRHTTGGLEWVSASGTSVREVLTNLDQAYPGLERLLAKGHAIAIDGEITTTALAETIAPDTEIQFLPAMQGG